MGKADDRLAQLHAFVQQLKAPPEPLQRLVLSPGQSAAMRKWQAEKPDGRKLDHALAIQNGLIPPPWAEKLLLKPARKAKTKPKPEEKLGWQEKLVLPILCGLWKPNGIPPAGTKKNAIVKQVGDAYQKKHTRTVGRNTILRTIKRQKKRLRHRRR